MLKRIIDWARGAKTIVEPFAGGASASIGCILAGVTERAVLAERDSKVRALWQTVLGPSDSEFERLCDFIQHEVGLRRAWYEEFAAATDDASPLWRRAALPLVRCRFAFGGIPHPKAGLVSDPQIRRLWRGNTMVTRMRRIRPERSRFSISADAMELIEEWSNGAGAAMFVDPPYSHGDKAPGSKLYEHHALDHDALLAALAEVRGRVLVTYDYTPATVALGARHGFQAVPLPMRDGRGRQRQELLLTMGG